MFYSIMLCMGLSVGKARNMFDLLNLQSKFASNCEIVLLYLYMSNRLLFLHFF